MYIHRDWSRLLLALCVIHYIIHLFVHFFSAWILPKSREKKFLVATKHIMMWDSIIFCGVVAISIVAIGFRFESIRGNLSFAYDDDDVDDWTCGRIAWLWFFFFFSSAVRLASLFLILQHDRVAVVRRRKTEAGLIAYLIMS